MVAPRAERKDETALTFNIPDTVDIPDGVYTAMLQGVENDKGAFGDFRRWQWLIDVPGEKGTEIVPLTQLTSANTGPQSKSYKQLTALLGAAPKAGENIEPPTGKRVTVTINHNEKGFPTVAEVGAYVDPQQTIEGLPR